MTQNTVHTRATIRGIETAINAIPQGVSGGALGRDVMLRAGLALLGRIRRAFVVKARGGTDEAGERWAPLKPSTIAYSRRGRTRTEKKRDARPSQALTKPQQTRWWAEYRRGLAMYRGDKGRAARRAWFILKAAGATTLFDKYAGRRVEILRDTGLLLSSLSPGSGSAEQILRAERGAIIVGTNRRGAAAHHNGVPGRLPQRRLWPRPADWPASWWADILDQVKKGVADAIARAALMKGG